MDAKILFVDDADQRETIEGVQQLQVDVLVVLLATLLVEVHCLGHQSSLVVASEHDYLLWVLDFESHQADHHFDSHESSVYEVAQKEKVFFWFCLEGRKEAEDFEQVLELSVNVSYHNDWIVEIDYIGERFLMREEYC